MNESVAEISKIVVETSTQNVSDPLDHSESGHGQNATSNFFRFKLAYGVTAFAIGAPFSAFNTYTTFQLQIIGYTIGHEPGNAPGTGCSLTATACSVPFGSGYVNYVSFFNYINAICYAVSGALILIFSGIGDRLGYQRAQYILLIVVFGILCLPAASLKDIDRSTFDTFAALYVAFNFIGFLAGTWGKVFIPFLMHKAEETDTKTYRNWLKLDKRDESDHSRREKRERSGLSMSVWSNNSLSIGQIVVLVITIGVTYVSSLYAGLYVTTASGVVCIILALGAWPFLPNPQPHRSSVGWKALLKAPFRTFVDLLKGVYKYSEAFKVLLAFTIYADSALVFGGVTSSLFVLNVSRESRIFTAYGIVQPASALLAGILVVLFAPLQARYKRLSFKNIMMFCLAMQAFVALWCCIGIAKSAKIGYKHGWEFYLWQAVLGFTGALIQFAFNILFAQLFPRGREIEYFGFQTVLSCGTIWIPQIVNGPIVQSTNIVRLPAAVCLATFIVSIALVACMDDVKGIKRIEEEAEHS